MSDLPAVDRIGYALDLIGITPFDIGAVDSSLVSGRRLLSIDFGNTRPVVINGVTYSVPRNVSVTTDNQITRGEYITFPNGKDAASAFSSDASYPLRYFAVSGTTSAAYAARKSFLSTHQYAFFSFTKGAYSARLQDYIGSLAEAPLIRALEGFPKPFNPLNEGDVKKYKDFFSNYGSHVIINVNYGARYPLKIWASNQSPDVNKMFNTDVKAKFKGIPSGGEFDPVIEDQDQYKRFSEYFQFLVSISGGGDSSKLANTSGTYDDYTTWIASISENSPGLLGFQVVELWSLMKYAESQVLRSYADPLYDAFTWIVGHPNVYKTAVILDIQSDWAEFNLLTPSAVIIPDPINPYPPTNTVASDTRVQWGKQYSHDYRKETLRFFVINDGSPIDFSTSHGSAGAGGSTGKAIVTIMNTNFENSIISDNVWNTMWFYKAAVNSDPVPGFWTGSQKPFYSWDKVLQDYLATHV